MPKLTLTNITSGLQSTSVINTNNDLIETALENTLSRDGTSPNTMEANIDMNSYSLLNVAAINGVDTTDLTNLGAAIAATEASAAAALVSETNAAGSAVAAASSAVDADSSATAAAAYSTLGLATGTTFDLGLITDLTIIFPTDWGTIV